MKTLFIVVIAALCCTRLSAQSYEDSVRAWQQRYKAEFLTDTRSPVKAADTGFIRFFPVDARWRVLATVTMTPEAQPFDMATHSGRTKKFRQWCLLRFPDPSQPGKSLLLAAYERVDAPKGDSFSAHMLFIPFNDETNGEASYGGGRYLDISKHAVENGLLMLDFNQAYNPYCAFGEGYSCPIPPRENKLPVAVRAGEKMWAKPTTD